MAKKITKKPTQKVEEIIKEEIVIQTEQLDPEIIRMCEWCKTMGKRMSANALEISWVFNWYTMVFGKSAGDLSCPGCIAHAIRSVQAYSANNYKQVDGVWLKI